MKNNTQIYYDLNLGVRSYIGPAKRMELLHSHSEFEINWILNGNVTYDFSGVIKKIPPKTMVVFSGSTPHRIINIKKNSKIAWFTMPLSYLYIWNLPHDFNYDILSQKIIIEDNKNSFIEDWHRIQRWNKDLKNNSNKNQHPNFSSFLHEMHARLLRFQRNRITNVTPDCQKQLNSTFHPLIPKMLSIVLSRFREPINLSDIAQELGYHSTYLSDLFAKKRILDFLNI